MRLRRLNHNDVILFKKWVYKDFIAQWFDDPLAWINEIENRNGKFNWINHFIAVLGKKDIGFCQFYEYKEGKEDWHGDIELKGTYSIDYFIGERDYLNQGYGREIIKLLTNTIFAVPHAQRIIAQPAPDNAASCNALLSAGFMYDIKNKLWWMTRKT